MEITQGFLFFYVKESWNELSNEEDDYPEFTPPPPPPRPRDDSQHKDIAPPPFSGGNHELIATQSGRALG